MTEHTLPPLPECKFHAWVQHGEVVNAFPSGISPRAKWDYDGYWAAKGFDKAPLFTEAQMRAYALAALSAPAAAPVQPSLYVAASRVLAMCDAIGEFRNGVTDPTGSIDEGAVRASELLNDLRAALSTPLQDAPAKRKPQMTEDEWMTAHGCPPRKLLGYGDCKCILTKYCDGQCNPIYENRPPPGQPLPQGKETP